LAIAGAAAIALAAPAAASITGVCLDGSIFIVQRLEAVPCREHKLVDPSDVPPVKPQYLPRPYGWEKFNRRNDPNNPYNLIQSPPPIPAATTAPSREEPTAQEAEPSAIRVPQRSEFQTEASSPRGLQLGLQDTELRDLSMIVELSQSRAPAAIQARDSMGRLRLARSRAFEERMRGQLLDRGHSGEQPVVLFVADADADGGGSFYGNLTFVQGSVAFQPSAEDPYQLGVMQGHLGSLSDGTDVLGYVILPEHMNLSEPLDIYWNDRQITATLQP
jgi:hypothetical protein